MSKKLKLDGETADRITLLTLKSYRRYLKKELKDHEEKGTWLHEDDVWGNTKTIAALTLIIDHFGGE
jgi:hypothetical protein